MTFANNWHSCVTFTEGAVSFVGHTRWKKTEHKKGEVNRQERILVVTGWTCGWQHKDGGRECVAGNEKGSSMQKSKHLLMYSGWTLTVEARAATECDATVMKEQSIANCAAACIPCALVIHNRRQWATDALWMWTIWQCLHLDISKNSAPFVCKEEKKTKKNKCILE